MYINPEKWVRSSEDARAAHGQQFVEADSNPEPRCKLSLLSLLRLSRQSSPPRARELKLKALATKCWTIDMNTQTPISLSPRKPSLVSASPPKARIGYTYLKSIYGQRLGWDLTV